MAAPKKRRPALRDAGNGHRNIASKPAAAVGIDIETGQRFDIEVGRADLIDIVDELDVIHATSTAAFLVFCSRTFLSTEQAHKHAMSELLNNLEEKISALHERLNADLDARRGGRGGAA